MKEVKVVSSDPQVLMNGAKEINKCLESLFSPDEYIGLEGVLVMALVARVGVTEARRLFGLSS